MKKIVFLLSLLLSSVSMFADENQFIPIHVLDDTVVTSHTHRNPDYVPMQAYYDAFTASVCVTFLENIGNVDILIENAISGDYEEYHVDSSLGATFLPVNGTESLYRILFSVSNGVEYEGLFEIEY